MPRSFSSATAEQVLSVVSAVLARKATADVDFVSKYCDLPLDRSKNALELAVDLGFLKKTASGYRDNSPISKLLRTPKSSERAAVLRTMLESYEPFIVFREENTAAGSAEAAAQRTKTLLDLDAHREDIKATLVSLATFSGALRDGGGGQYERDTDSMDDMFITLATRCKNDANSEQRVRDALGNKASVSVSYDQVLRPLVVALRFAVDGNGREAVVNAGNAVESFLVEYAAAVGVSLTGQNGINRKVTFLKGNSHLPTKLSFKGQYLGHLRNAADHGIDTESTGQEYFFVSCSFIRNVVALIDGDYEV